MRDQNSKSQLSNSQLCLSVLSLQLLVVFALCGCAAVEFVRPSPRPHYDELWQNYSDTKLKESTSAEVLETIHMPEYELPSQSKRIIASAGQKKRTYYTWFNMVAFDENQLTAKRKYLFMIDERPKILFTYPWAGIMYDCEMVLEPSTVDDPYANENTRRIAVLRKVRENLRDDMEEVGSDNKALATSGMLINQAFEAVLAKLDASPALASKLHEPAGVEFPHINLDKGKIQMLVEDDVVTVKMMLGSFIRYFEKEREKDQEQDQDQEQDEERI